MVYKAGSASGSARAMGPALVRLTVTGDFAEMSQLSGSAERQRMEDALRDFRATLSALPEQSEEQRDILQTLVEMSEDPELLEQVWTQIDQGYSSEHSFHQACEQVAGMLAALDDEYLCGRAQDVRELDISVRGILQGRQDKLAVIPGGILLTESLKIQDSLLLGAGKIAAVAAVKGGPTDHAAILAASAGVSMLFGLSPDALSVATGTVVTLDPYTRELDTQPSESKIRHFQRMAQGQTRLETLLRQNSHLPARTIDGELVHVLVNASDETSLRLGLEHGADGCGLLRTELTWGSDHGPLAALPDEEEQYQRYLALLSIAGEKEVTFRTFDFGADKPLAEGLLAREENPALGVRGIRLALQKPSQVLLPQLKALLRAGYGHKLKVMFPMVCLPKELADLRAHWRQAKEQLRVEGKDYARQAKVGIMIEVPMVAYHLERFCHQLEFASIGSNDLQQYFHAADRLHPHLASYRQNLSPNFLTIVADIVAKAQRNNLEISLCGALASDLTALPLLIGLGLRRISVTPTMVSLFKGAVRRVDSRQARELWLKAAEATDGDEVQNLVSIAVPWSKDPLLMLAASNVKV